MLDRPLEGQVVCTLKTNRKTGEKSLLTGEVRDVREGSLGRFHFIVEWQGARETWRVEYPGSAWRAHISPITCGECDSESHGTLDHY